MKYFRARRKGLRRYLIRDDMIEVRNGAQGFMYVLGLGVRERRPCKFKHCHSCLEVKKKNSSGAHIRRVSVPKLRESATPKRGRNPSAPAK